MLTNTVCTGCRPAGRSRSSLTSRSPKTVMAMERGIGVAVMTSVCGLAAAFSASAARCSTPNRCCSSTTTRPRSKKVTGSLSRAWVPMTMPASPDAAAIRTAKTLISTALPVVGGIASDASSAVLAAAGVVKNSIGVFGLVAVAALCAGPFAVMSMKLLLLKAAGAVTDMLPYGGVSRLIWDIGSAVSILLGLLGCCGIMLFISTMAGIKAVNV